MDLEFFVLGGYGLFVWSAFLYTFTSCFYLYLKTRKEFQKQEKIFLTEFKQSKALKFEVITQKKYKRNLSEGSIF